MFRENPFKKLEPKDWLVWAVSTLLVTVSYVLAKDSQPLTLIACIIGTTMLIFDAKGDVWGQVLTFIFSMIYGIISYRSRYYGEMITYMGMTAPMALMAVVSWLRHPFEEGKNEVEVAVLSRKQTALMFILAVPVTVLFYYILRYFNTANLFLSTISITTSFLACYLTFMRSSAYAIAYAANDLVLIVLWVLASMEDSAYFSMVMCFAVFFYNDLYGYFGWRKIHKRQCRERRMQRI